MAPGDLAHRFNFHPATTDEKRDAHATVRTACHGLAELFDQLCPEGREQALAVTKIEEAMFWANAALARQQ
ncbi:hypothetical protein ACFXP3_14145 [Streptomyces sp. NPDC059096]|uniref:Acb2/Tad1 domain-containing protein n=1 Tax=Streptomyces sp. NPDC059096 TaxID=3346727 RepID=UPI0036B6AD19